MTPELNSASKQASHTYAIIYVFDYFHVKGKQVMDILEPSQAQTLNMLSIS